MNLFLCIFFILAAYSMIGCLYGGYRFPILHCELTLIGRGHFAKEGAIWEGIFWPFCIIWQLLQLPAKHFARAGILLGEMQLAREQAFLLRQKELQKEQERVRVQLREIEESSQQEAEECCRIERAALLD
jgi:hypothetical protein